VAILLLITFSTFFTENDYRITFNVIIHFSGNLSSCYSRGANVHFASVFHQQNTIKFYFGSCFGAQTVYKDLLVFLHFELLPCYLYDCVHNRLIFNLIWRAKIANFFNNRCWEGKIYKWEMGNRELGFLQAGQSTREQFFFI
jgi:hypothetical protein